MIHWEFKKFDNLSAHELYAIIQLRNEVFVVEQNCVFQDADNKDQLSHHLMGWQQNKLIAYTRILPPALAYSLPSIGRVVTSPSVRRNGMGTLLMKKSIELTEALYGHSGIHIGAQLHLKKFYETFHFVQCSDPYLEDGIEHIEMKRESLLRS
ncbi:MAG TPA: GNAT family N-acetyltransferase [Chitinophagaceae bacterium]